MGEHTTDRPALAARLRRPLGPWAAAFVGLGVYCVVALVWLFPLIRHLESSVLFGATDSTGAISDYWAAEHTGHSPFTFDHNPFDGAPEGYPRSTTLTVANAIQPAVIWGMKGAVGLVGAWNLFTIAGFVLSAWAAFLLLRHLRFGMPTALVGGYVFGFGPWMFARAYEGHSGMQHIWVIPLLFYTLLQVRRTRSLLWAAAAGATLGLGFYLHSYIGLMAGVLLVTAYALDVATATGRRLRALLLSGVSVVASLVLFAPPLLMFGGNPESVTRGGQPFSDIVANGANIRDYFLPSARNPILGWMRPLKIEGEHTLFFGYVTLALALVGAVLALRRRKLDDERSYAAALAVAGAVIAFLTSLKPVVHIGPIGIPTPSDVTGHLVSYWRVYARVGVDVGLCLVVLASFAFERILARRHGLLLGGAVTALLVVELAVGPPIPIWRTNYVAPHVQWLADHPGGIVANYPLPVENQEQIELSAREFWNITHHEHPVFALWGGNNGGTREEAIRIVASDLTNDQTASVLTAEHVRYVVVHDAVYRAEGVPPPKLDPKTYTLVARPGSTRIYTVHAPPAKLDEVLLADSSRIAQARAYPTPDASYDGGFNDPETFTDGRQWRWMTQNGGIDVRSVNPGRYLLVLDAFSNGSPRTVTLVGSDGKELGRAEVPGFRTQLIFGPVELDAPTRLALHAEPGPGPLGANDPRSASIFVSPFELRPAPDFYGRLNS